MEILIGEINFMAGTKEKNKHIALFEGNKVRRVWHDERWFFVIVDIITILTDSIQPEGYIKDMRRRDEELSKGWGQIATPLSVLTEGGQQKMNCADLEGIFRIIQSIPSPKAEPFKQWLAKVGKERVDEIMQGTFDMKVDDYKKHKNLSVQHNLRDHMGDIELILTMLAEATTTKLSVDHDSEGFNKLHADAKEGGEIVGKTRKEIKNRSGKNIATKNNYLNTKSRKKLK
ncbi:hypothetical protein A3A03_02435 [Candidatus Nomurabacteria bacterium RIFCSPLOWO2_01_FULL_40_18]|uniref:Bro-N domain-containing protein n=1 Tax=Candidatus Nomurabacteria bacterium RIFCSPLOWO2_01_FULL_40_18 TaxID=1801773 RepID=A0A1F6XKG2_9BACT|nr:MAG: hypothetical protein A3A03_02435 [Candidatus Nomurabacteria bacterium RIFCSPLOWO2_01_FULL_40_18]